MTLSEQGHYIRIDCTSKERRTAENIFIELCGAYHFVRKMKFIRDGYLVDMDTFFKGRDELRHHSYSYPYEIFTKAFLSRLDEREG